jgi:spore coat polysaccharide biosynthesis predicted glycosyltransferase SpsG
MLRKEFLAYKGWQREIAPVAKKILVTLGGSDPDNVTLKVIQALIDLDLHAKVVIGGSNPHLSEIENFIQSQNNSTAVIDVIVNATNMPELMAWGDLALAAGGSTAWELSFMGLPSLFVILADNQVGIATELENAGFGVCLGRGIDLKGDRLSLRMPIRQHSPNNFFDFMNNKSLRQQISLNCKNLVDGGGAKRMSEIF